jgi:hypothetical protein
MKNIVLFALLFVFLLPTNTNGQRRKTKGKREKKTATKPEKSKIRTYADFVKKDSKTTEGLFKVHEHKDNFLYEIPKSYLGKEMLLVTRIKELPADLGGGYVNAGSKINTQVIV